MMCRLLTLHFEGEAQDFRFKNLYLYLLLFYTANVKKKIIIWIALSIVE